MKTYTNIKPNPTIENVQSGVAAFKAAEADYIIAIGGGSSMDTAKGVGIVIANPDFADIRSLEGVAPTKNKSVPIFAVPTTAGTAAEVPARAAADGRAEPRLAGSQSRHPAVPVGLLQKARHRRPGRRAGQRRHQG